MATKTCVLLLALSIYHAQSEVQTKRGCDPKCKCYDTGDFKYQVICPDLPEQIPLNTTVFQMFNGSLDSLTTRDTDRFSENPNMKTLDLCSVGLNHLERGALSKIKSLTILKLSYNHLRQLNQKIFQGCSKIEEIYLDFNLIEDLESTCFASLVQLKALYLQGNKIKTIPVLPVNLAKLDLSGNKIQRLQTQSLTKAQSLEYLDVCGNPVRDFDDMSNASRKLRSLCTPLLPEIKPNEDQIIFPMENLTIVADSSMRPALNSLSYFAVVKDIKYLTIEGYLLESPQILKNLLKIEILALRNVTLPKEKEADFTTAMSVLQTLLKIDLEGSQEVAKALIHNASVWESFVHLELIGLRHCGLRSLGYLRKAAGTRVKKLYLDIRQNNLLCDCAWKKCFERDLRLLGDDDDTLCATEEQTFPLLEFFKDECSPKNASSEPVWTVVTQGKQNEIQKNHPRKWQKNSRNVMIVISVLAVGFAVAVVSVTLFFYFRRRGHGSIEGGLSRFSSKKGCTSQADLVDNEGKH